MDPTLVSARTRTGLTYSPRPPAGPAAQQAGTGRAGLWWRLRTLAADLARLARPAHWVKNLVVVPLALVGTAGPTLSDMTRAGWAVLAFCLASSAVYVGNDITDRHRDRVHPVKRERPVAAGRISPAIAGAFALALATALLAVTAFGPDIGWWPLLVYLGLNIAYSRWLKQVPLLDMFVIASGFGLRLIQGYVAVGVAASSWLLIAVFAVCLLLILGKRRHEVGAVGAEHRPSLAGYSSQFLEYLMVLCGAVTVTAGLLYLNDAPNTPPHPDALLLLSVPLAIFGLARYLQLVVVRSDGGDPVRLLRDPVILATALLWATAVAAVAAVPQPALEALSSPPP